jgi:signal transduction histidine kinase
VERVSTTVRTGQNHPWGLRLDGVVGAGLAVAMAVVAAAAGYHGWHKPLAVVVSAGLAALAARRRWPLAVLVAVGVTAVSEAALTASQAAPPLVIALMVAAYSLGAYTTTWRSAVPGVAFAVASIAGAQALSPPSGYSAISSLALFASVAVLVPFAAGRIIRSRWQLAGRLRETTQLLEHSSDGQALAGVAAERARLGRSIESTVLAGLDALAGHAQVASLDDVEAVRTIARHTLGGVRGLLGGLRGESEPTGPPPSLAELRTRLRAALAIEEEAATPSRPGALPGRWSMPPSRWIDWGLRIVAVAYGVGLVATTVAHSRPAPEGLDVALAIVMAAAVAGLRRWAVLAGLVSCAAAIAYSAAARPLDPLSGLLPTAVLVLVPVAAGIWESQRTKGLALLGGCLLTIPALVLVDRGARLHPGSLAPTPAFVIGFFAIAAVLQSRSRAVAELADAVLRLDQARAARRAAAIRAERERLAHELHDVMAHSLTAILLQAAAARRVWQSNPDLARKHVRSLRDTLASSLGELRDLIISITMGADVNVGLDRLASLVERARASGVGVDLCVTGSPSDPPPGTGRAGYRIVQEALTNAARHAPGSRVTVEVFHCDVEVVLRVLNGPPARPTWQPIAGAGHGIDGMRSRAVSCGGQFKAEPVPGGGFSVSARLPLTAAS